MQRTNETKRKEIVPLLYHCFASKSKASFKAEYLCQCNGHTKLNQSTGAVDMSQLLKEEASSHINFRRGLVF